jgi:bis(5'-nucleosyl)-tetraphosphatase (symmetrical)
MAQWAIGDVQGCLAALRRLITAIEAQDARARFYFCGDLVNRGEDSLSTLQFVQTLAAQGRAHTVLGNHDLYALACAAGFLQPKAQDTFTELLAAPELWVDWLRQQPLAIDIHTPTGQFLLTHAGVWPSWSASQTLGLAARVENVLQADSWAAQLQTLWHGGARLWRDDLSALDAPRFTVNALMRMRLIAPDGGLDFDVKEAANDAPAGYMPWFELPSATMQSATQKRILVFGHWSALGLRNEEHLIALDTGCVWGRQLTAVELVADAAKRRVVQVDSRAKLESQYGLVPARDKAMTSEQVYRLLNQE